MITMDTISKVTLTAKGKNAKGGPATIAGVVFDSTDGAGKITIFPLPDGVSANVLGIGVGTATVKVTALGITKNVAFTITAAPAVDFDVLEGPVVSQ